MCREGEVMWEDIHCGLNVISPRSGKKNKFGHFLVIVQLIHRLTQADISCTTTATLVFPHCLVLCHFYCPKLKFLNSPTKERKTDSVARGTASLRGLQPGGSSATGHPLRHPRRAARDRGHQEGCPLNSSQCAPYISGI